MLPNIEAANIITSTFDFLPELVLCVAIVFLLLLRLLRMFDRAHLGSMALLFTLIALGLSVAQWMGAFGLKTPDPGPGGRPFLMFGQGDVVSGMLIYDHFTVFMRCFLFGFTALVIWLSMLTGIPDREDSADFYVLLLGAVVGMSIMASSAHLLMVFIGIEMASLPSYALAGFLKGKRQSSEAALKYVVYGGGASGVMLYGISLLAGKFGTGYLPDLAIGYAASLAPIDGTVTIDPILVLGTLFLLIGIAFKLSAVPFHFWCPDVFEGASAEVAGFLSVASKGAALALLARVTLILGGLDSIADTTFAAGLPWMTVVRYLVPALAFFAALTATFGNLAAYRQNNLKRLLAYSTIAHAGYMMMGLCTLTRSGVEAMLFYLVAYLFMNLGAFAVVAFLRNQTHSEDLADFRGLVRRSPVMVVTLAFFMLSLLGLPPLVGFAAKFQIFKVLFDEGQAYYRADQPGLGATLMALLVIGGVNTVISAFYYIRVLKVMTLDSRAEDLEGTEPVSLRPPMMTSFYAVVMAVLTLGLGVAWDPLAGVSRASVTRFRARPGMDPVQVIPPPPKGPPIAGAAGGFGMPGKGKGKGMGKGKKGPGKGKGKKGPAKGPEL
jgi:NADH-quinone oxidoreductase subunit N